MLQILWSDERNLQPINVIYLQGENTTLVAFMQPICGRSHLNTGLYAFEVCDLSASQQ